MNCNRGKGFSGDRQRGDDSVSESCRLFLHLPKVASANIVFGIVSQCHPLEVARGVFETFQGPHVCHLFMCYGKEFASDIISFVGFFIGNIWTVSTVILPSFKKESIHETLTRVVGVLADYVKDRIGGCSFTEVVVPFAFKVLSKLKGTNIKGSGVWIRARVIIIDRGVREGKLVILFNRV